MEMIQPGQPQHEDPLIDEVRSLRRSLCDGAGNDVDRLSEQLEEILREYEARAGRFADVPRERPEGELFPEAAHIRPDPLLDEVRELRNQGSRPEKKR